MSLDKVIKQGKGKPTMTEQEAITKLVDIIGELLYYIPDMGWVDSSRFARRLIEIKEELNKEKTYEKI